MALDAEEREILVLGMLANTLSVLAASPALAAVHVVAADEDLAGLPLPAGNPIGFVIQSAGGGLNEALCAGRDVAVAAGATAVLMLPADLPLLRGEALDELLEAADATLAAGNGAPLVVVAPADARNGTNALLLAPPAVIEPHFGLASFEAHLRAAEAAGASVQVVDDARLGFDLDTPDDLERLDLARQLELQLLGEQTAAEFLFAASG